MLLHGCEVPRGGSWEYRRCCQLLWQLQGYSSGYYIILNSGGQLLISSANNAPHDYGMLYNRLIKLISKLERKKGKQ